MVYNRPRQSGAFSGGLGFLFVLGLVAMAGCAARQGESVQAIPMVGDPIQVLAARSEMVVGIRANGRCRLRYYDQGKQRNEHFAVKIWLDPPERLYLQGDIAFDQRGLVAASNADEFWLWLRPKEISSYWWGRWSVNKNSAGLILSPRILLEVFGVIEIPSGAEVSFARQGDIDVVTVREDSGRMRKLYLAGRQRAVSRIEYFDRAGEVTAFAEMEKYKEAAEGFSVPRVIRIVNVAGGEEDSVEIKLSSVRPMSFDQRHKENIFTRPEAKGFKRVYEIVEGDVRERGRY